MQLKGTGVALITPFTGGKEIDFQSLGGIIDHCIDGGVNYLVSLGTTGETVTMNAVEKQEILDFTKSHVHERVPLIAGFGGNNTALIISNLRSFNLEGYSAILSSSPNYNKPTQEGLYQHYKALSEASPLPIILYNVPSRTGQNLNAETTIRLANDFDNIIGIKEASNDFLQCMEIIKSVPKSFQLISGDDVHALPMFSIGSVGVISVIAQGIPHQFTNMVNSALSGNFEKASEEQFKFLALIQLIFQENNPAGIKSLLNILNLCDNNLRLPLTPATDELKKKITSFMGKYN